MPETTFKPAEQQERQTWQKMGLTFRDGMSAIRQRPLLVTILGIALVYGLYSEALDRLWEAHFLDSFTLPAIGSLDTVVWFGIINAAIMIVAIGTTEIVRRQDPTNWITAIWSSSWPYLVRLCLLAYCYLAWQQDLPWPLHRTVL